MKNRCSSYARILVLFGFSVVILCLGCDRSRRIEVSKEPYLVRELTEADLVNLPEEIRVVWPDIRTGRLLGVRLRDHAHAFAKADLRRENHELHAVSYEYYLTPGGGEPTNSLFVILDIDTDVVVRCGVGLYIE